MNLHERFESLVDLYLAGAMSPAERDEVVQHTGDCGGCATLLQDAKEFQTWVRGAIVSDAPPNDLEERIIAGLRGHSAAATPSRLKSRLFMVGKIVASIAAVLMLMMLGGDYMGVRSDMVPSGRVQFKSATMDTGTVELTSNDRDGNPANGYWGGEERLKGAATRNLEGTLERKSKNLEEGLRRVQDMAKLARAADPGQGDLMADSNVADAKVYDSIQKESKNQETITQEIRQDRKLIFNGDIAVEVEAYEPAYKKVSEIANAAKGFIAGANTQKLANGKIRATVTLRIPPDKFEETLLKLRDLGTVRNQSISTQDVTKQYTDLESRKGSKEALLERLKKVLAEGKGNVKELMEVEVQMGATIEAIESIKGELKYYDNMVGLSTITLQLWEKDLGQPFEYVQTLQSNIGLTVTDPDGAYAAAQRVVTDAGGQVTDSRMTRNNHGSAQAYVQGRVDADKFPAVREALRKLGHVDADTVNQQKVARGGQGAPKFDAPVKREQAVIDLNLTTPSEVITKNANVTLESSEVEKAYLAARKIIEDAGGKVDGTLTSHTTSTSANIRGKIDAAKFSGVVEALKALGSKVINAGVTLNPPNAENADRLVKEMGTITLQLNSPAALMPEAGIGQTIKETFTKSIEGLLMSVQKLFVGISLAGPWIVLLIIGVVIYRKAKKKKATA